MGHVTIGELASNGNPLQKEWAKAARQRSDEMKAYVAAMGWNTIDNGVKTKGGP